MVPVHYDTLCYTMLCNDIFETMLRCYKVCYYDMLWYSGLLWYSMICYDTVLCYDTVWYAAIYYDKVWYDIIYATPWHTMIKYIWYSMLQLTSNNNLTPVYALPTPPPTFPPANLLTFPSPLLLAFPPPLLPACQQLFCQSEQVGLAEATGEKQHLYTHLNT